MRQWSLAPLIAIAPLALLATLPWYQAAAQSTGSVPDVAHVPETPSIASIDPRFRAVKVALESGGPRSTYFGPDGLPAGVRVDGVSAMLRFEKPLTTLDEELLRRAGVELLRRGGRLVVVGSVYGAFVPWASLDELARHPRLVAAEVAWHPRLEMPLNTTGPEVGAARAAMLPLPDADGSGSVIGDIDSGIDVLHPHFFFADGGAFPWIDKDGDGEFSPGVDAIDYNRDGEANGNETARVLDGARLDFGGDVTGADGVLDVRRDWLYVDANRDGERNVGLAAGFTEFDPGYGEPVFVVDDVDGDGTLDPEERVYLLGTSKIRRYVTSERTWVRGEDLIASAEEAALDSVYHGTAVSSIAVGGQPTFHDRVGIAPGAEIVMYSSHIDVPFNGFENTPQLADLQDAVASGLDVLIHEWTNPYTAPHDGSGNFEAAMDTAHAAGVFQVNPLGNLNRSQKHAQVDVPAGGETDLTFVIDEGFTRFDRTSAYSSIFGSVFWRTGHVPTIAFVNPNGEEVVLPLDDTILAIGDDSVQAVLSVSSRGTHQAVFHLWTDDEESLLQGDWGIRITDVQVDSTFVARIGDYYSGWAVGVRWKMPLRGVGTAVYPSTADSAFGVAAYGGRHQLMKDGTVPGELREYSGRGPRIDGARVTDLAAPDDPYVALAAGPWALDAGYGRSWYSPFGGTSGAGAHVAGAVALIRATQSGIAAGEIVSRLHGSARVDAYTPEASTLPDAAWGAGKLDVYAAVNGGPSRAANSAPRGTLELSYTDGDEVGFSAHRSSDPDGDELQYRWDLDYDGFWDTEWSTEPTIASEYVPGAHSVRLSVRDDQGGVGGAILRFELPGDDNQSGVDAGSDAGVAADDDAGSSRGVGGGATPICGCASAGDGGFWSLLLFGLFALRRQA